MREEAERLDANLGRLRSQLPNIRLLQDELRARLAQLDPDSPEYVGGVLT